MHVFDVFIDLKMQCFKCRGKGEEKIKKPIIYIFYWGKGGKVQNTLLKEIRVRGLVIFREGISILNIRSTLREPFDFIFLFVL